MLRAADVKIEEAYRVAVSCGNRLRFAHEAAKATTSKDGRHRVLARNALPGWLVAAVQGCHLVRHTDREVIGAEILGED